MTKRILMVVGDERLRRRMMLVIQSLKEESDVRILESYAQAYKKIAESAYDVMICGMCGGAEAYRLNEICQFIQSVRRIRRYHFTPVILISGAEDPSGYWYRELRCYAVLEPAFALEAFRRCIEGALCYSTEPREEKMIFLLEQNVMYPLQIGQISHIQSVNHVMKICMENGNVHNTRYLTMQQLLEIADVPYLLQCSRSGIVNIRYVYTIDYTNRIITMNSRSRMAIGSTYVKSIRMRFQSVQDIWRQKKHISGKAEETVESA